MYPLYKIKIQIIYNCHIKTNTYICPIAEIKSDTSIEHQPTHLKKKHLNTPINHVSIRNINVLFFFL